MSSPSIKFAAALALLVTVGTAQGRLIGLTAGGGGSPELRRQSICSLPNRACPTGIPSPSGFAGGAAYNAMNRSVSSRCEPRRIRLTALVRLSYLST